MGLKCSDLTAQLWISIQGLLAWHPNLIPAGSIRLGSFLRLSQTWATWVLSSCHPSSQARPFPKPSYHPSHSPTHLPLLTCLPAMQLPAPCCWEAVPWCLSATRATCHSPQLPLFSACCMTLPPCPLLPMPPLPAAWHAAPAYHLLYPCPATAAYHHLAHTCLPPTTHLPATCLCPACMPPLPSMGTPVCLLYYPARYLALVYLLCLRLYWGCCFPPFLRLLPTLQLCLPCSCLCTCAHKHAGSRYGTRSFCLPLPTTGVLCHLPCSSCLACHACSV